ncbi:MAG TPA: hypothetical protein VM510_03985 [Caulifigura sp.]|jgi:hypothetical protein|nr:hypothetical protein [Caulifigura sp.]
MPAVAKRLVIVVLCIAILYLWLSSIVNPADRNHLVIVNASEADLGRLSAIRFSDDSERQWYLTTDRPLGPRSVSVINIESAWLDGRVSCFDADGKLFAESEVKPRGRYGWSLVLTFGQNGHVAANWNALPQGPPLRAE